MRKQQITITLKYVQSEGFLGLLVSNLTNTIQTPGIEVDPASKVIGREC